MYNILSIIFKYAFIIIIFYFIYSIIRLIYLDIRGLSFVTTDDSTYIRLLNDIDSLPYLLKEYYLLNRDLRVGRGINNDIIIPDPYISQNHMEITREDNKHYLIDRNSANGTYLNGKKVPHSAELSDGDVITMGKIKFEFKRR